jgi:voltage-gated potassium channel
MTAATPSSPPPGQTSRRTVRQRIFECLEAARPGDQTSRLVDLVVLSMIMLNVAIVIFESTEPRDRPLPRFYDAFETVSVVFFTIEYLLRIWSIVEEPRYRHAILGRVRWGLTPLAIVDVLAIAPTLAMWLGLFGGFDLRVMRSLRLVRIFRLAKLTRYSSALQTFFSVLKERRGELGTSLFLLGVLLLISSSLMYTIENAAQPDRFASIPHAMWWAVATLTTVGYGDVFPVTSGGRALGAVIAVLGIGMFALPAGILGAAFSEALERQRRRQSRALATPTHCPHCGKALQSGLADHDHDDAGDVPDG